MRTRNGTVYLSVDTEVAIEIDDLVDDVIEQASPETKAKIREAFSLDRAPTGSRLDAIVEQAYNAARQMADLPREIRDLLWHVHGRAI